MAKGLDYELLFPGRFLKAVEFRGKDVMLTIAGIKLEDLPDKTRGILSFRETKKAYVLNRTNAECMRAMWGRDTGEWIGKRVTFYPAKIDSEVAEYGIRVRGSPDLKQPVTFELHLPRKRPRQVTLAVTKPGTARPANGGAPEPEPGEEPPAPGEQETDGADIQF